MKRFGLESTDLGDSFEHDGRVFFLFGNTHPTPDFQGKPNGPKDQPRTAEATDAIAFSSDTNGENCARLDFVVMK